MKPIHKLDGPEQRLRVQREDSGPWRELGDYTPRLLPRHPCASIPLEAHEILWQR